MNRPKVLCVDDDELILEALRRVLDQEYQVFTSTSTEHALELLETDRHFDIVISDYQMPGKNGIEFLREVKRRYPICVRCLLTGQITLDEISEFINKNIFHKFLIKPWDNQQLLLQMKEALQLLTLLKEKESLSQLAITDPVTQLTNHRFFQENIKKLFFSAKEDSTPLSLVMIDVDYFKSYNDHYGHIEGDSLLKEISGRLLSFLPEHCLLSRYGGEEFVITLPKIVIEDALTIANEIRTNFESHSFRGPQGRPAYITISVGVSTLLRDLSTAQDLVYMADQALYQAKRQGRNQVVKAQLTLTKT